MELSHLLDMELSQVVMQALRQHAAGSDVPVTAAALGTLTRVASACARLHLRSEILTTPDVVLSILLLEDSLELQVPIPSGLNIIHRIGHYAFVWADRSQTYMPCSACAQTWHLPVRACTSGLKL